MTIFGFTREPNPISESTPDDGMSEEFRQPKKGPPLYVIPLMLSVGLLVAATYIGNRVLAAKSRAARSGESVSATLKPPPPVVSPLANDKAQSTAADIPPAPKIQPPNESARPSSQAVAGPASGDSGDGMIVPRPGERYLQLAAIPTQTAPKFLSRLRSDNLQASLAAGPSEDLVRVLVGPFSDKDSLDRAKAQLDALRLECFVRVY